MKKNRKIPPETWFRVVALCLSLGALIGFAGPSTAVESARQTFDSIYEVVANPAGTRLAVGGTNGLLKIVDATTQADIRIFPVVPGPVYGISWNPNLPVGTGGTRLISGHPLDNAVRIWNATTGQLITRIGLANSFGYVTTAWSPNGDYIAVGQDVSESAQIFIFDAGTYELICNVSIRPLGTLTWRGQANVVLVGANNGLSAIDVSANCSQSLVINRTESVTAMSNAPTGNRIAVGTSTGSVIIADSTSMQALNTFQISTEVISSIGWSPDGATIRVTSQDNRVRVVNASNGSPRASYTFTQIAAISSTAFSPDGTRILFGDGTEIRDESALPTATPTSTPTATPPPH